MEVEKLPSQKYVPSDLSEVILLPRVRETINKTKTRNFLFYGNFGLGKSTVANILAKNHPTFYRNASKDTRIEVLRDDMTKFVNNMVRDPFEYNDLNKIIYLEEFEKTSSLFQDALKAFIDDESKNGTRFIFTTNHYDKVDGGIKSRCTNVNFNPINQDEVIYLKKNIGKFISDISKKDNVEISKEQIKLLINKFFPDIRKIVEVYSLFSTGVSFEMGMSGITDDISEKIFFFLTSSYKLTEIQDWLVKEVPVDSMQDLLSVCARPLIEHLSKTNKELLKDNKLGEIYSIVAEHQHWLSTSKGGDPYVVGLSCINSIHKLL